jgi:uncharacterized protein (UPF0335 family)
MNMDDDAIIFVDGSLEYFRDKAKRIERENIVLREQIKEVKRAALSESDREKLVHRILWVLREAHP